MNKTDVFSLLEQHTNPKGIEHWNKLNNTENLTSYGMGLTVQRKLAKQIGRSHELAQELWQTDNYDAKVISLLIDEPKRLTREQVEQQVEGVGIGLLAHVFSSCNATLPKAAFAFELAKDWLQHQDAMRRSCAYGLIYEFSKKKKKEFTDEFFIDTIERVEREFDNESKKVRLAMGTALMGIGKRSFSLNQEALRVARIIGPIDFNEDGQKCDPFNVEKHLVKAFPQPD